MAKKKIKEAEIVPPVIPVGPFIISVLVLMIALTDAVCGDREGTILGKADGEKVIKFVEQALHKTYPEVAPMIMGMFGLELLQLLPMLKDPEGVVQAMIGKYTAQATHAFTNTKPDTK